MFFSSFNPSGPGRKLSQQEGCSRSCFACRITEHFYIFLSSGSIHIPSGSGSILSGFIGSCRFLQDGWKIIVKNGRKPTCFLAQLCPAHSKRSDKYMAGSNLLLCFFRSSVLWPYMANLRAKALYSGFVHSDHESWQVSCTYLERLGDSCCLRCCVKRLDYHMNIVSITNGNDPTYSLISKHLDRESGCKAFLFWSSHNLEVPLVQYCPMTSFHPFAPILYQA